MPAPSLTTYGPVRRCPESRLQAARYYATRATGHRRGPAIRGHPLSHAAIRGHPLSHAAIRGHPLSHLVIRGQLLSHAVIRGQLLSHAAIRGQLLSHAAIRGQSCRWGGTGGRDGTPRAPGRANTPGSHQRAAPVFSLCGSTPQAPAHANTAGPRHNGGGGRQRAMTLTRSLSTRVSNADSPSSPR